MKAKDFKLKDQDGIEHRLSQYKGNWIVLYFYPKDDTPGCTKEACGFRDNMSFFSDNNVTVIGVSKDSVGSHKKFTEKYGLNFVLLSDPDKEVIKSYQAWGKKKFMGKTFEGTLRKTYLIDPEGDIIKTYMKVNPLVHAKEVTEDINSYKSGRYAE